MGRVSRTLSPLRAPPFSLTSPPRRYEQTQTIHGLPQPAGLVRCQRLPRPIYTPSTKGAVGEKDINITPAEARALVGDSHAARIEALALACYEAGAAYAEERGIIIVRSPPPRPLLFWCPRSGVLSRAC